jgi:predicted kinase
VPAPLVVLSGLPGSGKTTLARALAPRLGAAVCRVDGLEAAMWHAGVGKNQPTGLAAYAVAHALARPTLEAGTAVVIDAVNPVAAAREGWVALAAEAGAHLVTVEVVCPDPAEHRRRVEERTSDLPGFVVPVWAEVEALAYEPWTAPRLVVDSLTPLEQQVSAVLGMVQRT